MHPHDSDLWFTNPLVQIQLLGTINSILIHSSVPELSILHCKNDSSRLCSTRDASTWLISPKWHKHHVSLSKLLRCWCESVNLVISRGRQTRYLLHETDRNKSQNPANTHWFVFRFMLYNPVTFTFHTVVGSVTPGQSRRDHTSMVLPLGGCSAEASMATRYYCEKTVWYSQ